MLDDIDVVIIYVIIVFVKVIDCIAEYIDKFIMRCCRKGAHLVKKVFVPRPFNDEDTPTLNAR